MESLLPSAVALGATSALFVALYGLVRRETTAGKRLVLTRVRSGLDGLFDSIVSVFARVGEAGTKFQARRQAASNENVETLIRHATHTPLTVTHTDNHLSKMREHKTETALTPAQGRKLREKKLEERF